MKTVCVQGLGFVGSGMAIAVASTFDKRNKPKYNVIGIDLLTKEGKRRIDEINNFSFPFKTADKKVKEALDKARINGNLSASHNPRLFSMADVIIVDIPYDIDKNNLEQSKQLESFEKAIKTIAENLKENTLLLIETTIPPGTCEHVVIPLIDKYCRSRSLDRSKVHVAHSYERVMPGAHYLDSIKNYWRVFAAGNETAAKICKDFLRTIINTRKYPLVQLDTIIASEASKIIENSYRAVNIAFVEEWSRFAEDHNFDLYKILEAIRYRPTHKNIMNPGFGVGGYCLTKDPYFGKVASQIYDNKQLDFPMSQRAVSINDSMPLRCVEILNSHFGDLRNKRILLLGVSYRQDIGDTRYSPSMVFYQALKDRGAEVHTHDPLVNYWPEAECQVNQALPPLTTFDAVVFAVAHQEYQEIDLKKWISDKTLFVLDGNNILSEKQISVLKHNKLKFFSIGRGYIV